MSGALKSVCVYCGSSKDPKPSYVQAAQELGRILAHNNVQLVYGGGSVGLMGIVAQACLEAGGRVVGVITDFLMQFEGAKQNLTELHTVKSMHERKQKMFDLADGFVVLPGGLGTLDELFEIITWRQVGMHSKPIVFANIDNYWDPLIKVMIPHMIQERFVREADKNLFNITPDVKDVLSLLERKAYENNDFVSKWG